MFADNAYHPWSGRRLTNGVRGISLRTYEDGTGPQGDRVLALVQSVVFLLQFAALIRPQNRAGALLQQ